MNLSCLNDKSLQAELIVAMVNKLIFTCNSALFEKRSKFSWLRPSLVIFINLPCIDR